MGFMYGSCDLPVLAAHQKNWRVEKHTPSSNSSAAREMRVRWHDYYGTYKTTETCIDLAMTRVMPVDDWAISVVLV